VFFFFLKPDLKVRKKRKKNPNFKKVPKSMEER